MIVYRKHQDIDRKKWDECISRSANRRVYAFSWYLDLVSPGWEALVEEDYHSVFPLTWGKKAGMAYLFQPYFAQQLGLFSSEPVSGRKIELFLQSIPARFRYLDIQVTGGFEAGVKGVQVFGRKNHELLLQKSYQELTSAYSVNIKRNLKRAQESGLNTGRSLRAGDLVSLFRENYGQKEGKLSDIHYTRMEQIIQAGLDRGNGSLLAVFDDNGLLSAGAFFLKDVDRIYFLFAASSGSARENGAMSMLIDHFIRENAGTDLLLDFEGGNEAGIGRFYKSFGSEEVIYHRILWNRLPAVLSSVLQLGRAIRKQSKKVPL